MKVELRLVEPRTSSLAKAIMVFGVDFEANPDRNQLTAGSWKSGSHGLRRYPGNLFRLAATLWIAVFSLAPEVAEAQENPILETLIPADESLDWRLEVRSAPGCEICAPLVQLQLRQQVKTPTQCSLLNSPLPNGFELPNWSVIDYRQNVELLKRAVIETQWSNYHGIGFLRRTMQGATPDALRAAFWERFSTPILALFESGAARMETAEFDVDGTKTTLFRISQVEVVNHETFEGPWRVVTCDDNEQNIATYVFVTDERLERVLARFARNWMTILNYHGSTYLWHRALGSGFVLALHRTKQDFDVTTELHTAYWYSRTK